MKNRSNALREWQVQLAFYGMLLWLASFQLANWLFELGYTVLGKAFTGYTLGFLMAFAGALFWGAFKGRHQHLLGHPGEPFWLRAWEAYPGIGLVAFGLLSFVLIAFIGPPQPGYFTLALAVGGAVASQGLLPVVNHIDGRND